MIVTDTAQRHVTPTSLAGALWSATPQEFEAFWYAFGRAARGEDAESHAYGRAERAEREDAERKLDDFAKAVATAGRAGPGDPAHILAVLADRVCFHVELQRRQRELEARDRG